MGCLGSNSWLRRNESFTAVSLVDIMERILPSGDMNVFQFEGGHCFVASRWKVSSSGRVSGDEMQEKNVRLHGMMNYCQNFIFYFALDEWGGKDGIAWLNF